MGKALLSLLGLSWLHSLLTFLFHSGSLAHFRPVISLSKPFLIFALPLFHSSCTSLLVPYPCYHANLQAFTHVMIIRSHTVETQTGNGPSNQRRGSRNPAIFI